MSSAQKFGVQMKHNDSHETRLALLEQTCSTISQTLIRLEKKMDDGFDRLDKKIDTKFDYLDKKTESKFSYLDKKIDSVEKKIEDGLNRINGRIWTLFLSGIAAFSSMLALIAHIEKWI